MTSQVRELAAAVGSGWTTTVVFSLQRAFGIEQAVVGLTHEHGGRAQAVFICRPGSDAHRFSWGTVWIDCIDPGCSAPDGFAHAVSPARPITFEDLRTLVSDEPAVAVPTREDWT